MRFFRSVVFLMLAFVLMISPAMASGGIKVTRPAQGDHRVAAKTEKTAPALKIITPQKGDSWREGEEHEIKWSYTGQPGQFVQIELERPPGEFRKTNYLTVGRFPIGVNGRGSCKYKFTKGHEGPWKIEIYVENDKWYHGPTFSVLSK